MPTDRRAIVEREPICPGCGHEGHVGWCETPTSEAERCSCLDDRSFARAASSTVEDDARECEFCGHVFQTRRQRVEHEQRARRDERVLCPCGDVCSEGPNDV